MMLEKLRTDAGLSREELSRRLEVSAMTIRNWERGDTRPTAEHLKNLADVFGVTTDYLLGREGVKNNRAI